MKKKIVSFLLLATLLAFVSCGVSADGPSDEEVKELITQAISGNMSAYCHNAEVQSVEIVDRGEPQEKRNRTYYPVRIKAVVECEGSMLSKPGERTLSEELAFLENAHGEWEIRKISL